MSHPTQFINGTWLAGEGDAFNSINPANNDILWQGISASSSQIDIAIDSARTAFYQWADLSFEKRLAVIERYAEILAEHKEELATAIAQETGRLLWETRTEIGAMIGKVAISVRGYNERTGTVENPMPGAKAFIRHRPHGVVAVFGPYNFPAHLPNSHIVPALLAGNTVVFKPSELTPLVAQITMQLWEKAGLPKNIMIDCSHANSNKNHELQPLVAKNVIHQIQEGNTSIMGVMIESHLHGGNQSSEQPIADMAYGVSVTDACIDWDTTNTLLRETAAELSGCLTKRT